MATPHPPNTPLNAFPARNLGLLGEIDAAATLYCVFPLESSAMCNKKAVLRTAPFIIRVTICEQAPIVTLTTKATQRVAFLLRIALVIPAVWEIVAVMHKVSKSCESFLTCAYTTLTMNTIFPLLLLLIIVRVVNTLHKGFAVVNLDK